jgi:hypothetical protein
MQRAEKTYCFFSSVLLELELELGAALEPAALEPEESLEDGAAEDDEDAPLLGVDAGAELDEELDPAGWSLLASIDTEFEVDAGGVPEGVLLVPADEDDDGAEDDGAGVVVLEDEDEDGAEGAGVVVVLEEDEEPADGRSARDFGPSGPRSQP